MKTYSIAELKFIDRRGIKQVRSSLKALLILLKSWQRQCLEYMPAWMHQPDIVNDLN